ncbi:MAG TPA: hypothetical protein VK395_22490 [Gemmataceae bacterium]|nr:hypothetical protein [Gemmataceae bacterium]
MAVQGGQAVHLAEDEERRRIEDAEWAQHDPQVEESYGGWWVVPFERTIVAHGANPAAVLKEAARLTQRSPEELVACAIPHPDNWLADA